MTEIFCDQTDCIHHKEYLLKGGTVDHKTCSADAINLFFGKKEGHPCTMYEWVDCE